MEVRVCKASAAVVQRVPAAATDWFMEWQRGVTVAAEAFGGYRGTDVYPPADGQQDWVVVIHFDDDKCLQQWLAAPVRSEWLDKLRAKVGNFELKTLPGGFGLWFAGLSRGPDQTPPSWKIALTVLLGLYPTVMLLTILVGPFTLPLGLAGSMLIGNALSVIFLQWCVVPPLTAVLDPWLKANASDKRLLSVGGYVAIVLLLLGLALFFRLVAS